MPGTRFCRMNPVFYNFCRSGTARCRARPDGRCVWFWGRPLAPAARRQHKR